MQRYSTERDCDAFLNGPRNGDGFDGKGGSKEPRPHPCGDGCRRSEHGQTGDGGVSIDLSNCGIRPEDRIRLAEPAPAAASKGTGLSSINPQGGGEGTRQRDFRPVPCWAPRHPPGNAPGGARRRCCGTTEQRERSSGRPGVRGPGHALVVQRDALSCRPGDKSQERRRPDHDCRHRSHVRRRTQGRCHCPAEFRRLARNDLPRGAGGDEPPCGARASSRSPGDQAWLRGSVGRYRSGHL